MANFTEPILATRKRPRYGLTTVASRLPAGSDWRQGIDWRPEGCQPPNVAVICGDIDKVDGNVLDPVHFDPFMIYNPDQCNDAWTTGAEHLARAKRELDMGFGPTIARELLASSVGNPSLSSEATDVSGGGSMGWTEGLATLLAAITNAGYVGDVWTHAPTWLEPAFLATNVGQRDDDGSLWSGQFPAIFDAGYSGIIGPAGGPAAASGVTGWVYATGPVEWDQGPYLDEGAEAADILTNSRYTLAERAGIVRFDPCPVFAVLIEAF